MRTKNWSKISKNSWELSKKPALQRGVRIYAHTKIAIRKGHSGDYVVASEHKILKRAKTKKEIYKKAVGWMRKHPNG